MGPMEGFTEIDGLDRIPASDACVRSPSQKYLEMVI